MKISTHFADVLACDRMYLEVEWCERVVKNPERVEKQPDGRTRYWGRVPELGGKALRVVILPDGETIMTAFPDRMYDRRRKP